MVSPIPFILSYLIFFGQGKYVYVFYHHPRGALPQMCNVIRPFPLFSGGSGNMYAHKPYPIFVNFSGSFWKTTHIWWDNKKKKTFPFFREIFFPRQTAKAYPFPEKIGNLIRMQPPCILECGGGGGGGVPIVAFLRFLDHPKKSLSFYKQLLNLVNIRDHY